MSWDDYAQQYRQVDHLPQDLPPVLAAGLTARIGRLLDIGCGEGFLLDRIRNHRPDWEITGFEVSHERAEMARARGHEVLVDPDGTVPSKELFDVVACCHVIEHVPDDFEYARYLCTLLKPDGLLYIETPVKLRGAWYFRRNAEAGWVLDPTHVREYRSVEAANAPLLAAGLTKVAEECTPLLLSLASAEALVRRVLRRPAPTSGKPTGWRARQLKLPRYRVQSVLLRKAAD